MHMNNFIRNKVADILGLVPPAVLEAELEAVTERAEGLVASLADGYNGRLRENHALRAQLADKDEEIAFLKGLLVQQIEQAHRPGHSVVVDDRRSPNELAEIRELDDEVYQVTDPSRRGVTINHGSEQLVCEPDYTSVNSGPDCTIVNSDMTVT